MNAELPVQIDNTRLALRILPGGGLLLADSQGIHHSSCETYFDCVELGGPGDFDMCGKVANEIVGLADVINDPYAGPGPMLPKIGL